MKHFVVTYLAPSSAHRPLPERRAVQRGVAGRSLARTFFARDAFEYFRLITDGSKATATMRCAGSGTIYQSLVIPDGLLWWTGDVSGRARKRLAYISCSSPSAADCDNAIGHRYEYAARRKHGRQLRKEFAASRYES